jgi:hypothetical protein
MTQVILPPDIAERASDFVGRRWVLDQVVDWMEHKVERFMLITGEPGSGKTALAAWLAGAGPLPEEAAARANLERVRAGWSAAHYCIGRGQDGTLDPVNFVRLLAQQLSGRYTAYAEAIVTRISPNIRITQEIRENLGEVVGVQINTFVVNTNPKDAYDRLVRDPLKALFEAQPKLQVSILVDGLDEALFFGVTNIVMLLAGSDDLPPGVRFLLTSRNEPRVLSQFPKRSQLDLSNADNARMTDDDIRAYVRGRLAEEAIQKHMAALNAPAGIEDQLVRHAAGNFLYGEFLLDEVAAGKRSMTDMAGLPRGLYGLYREFLDRLLPEMLQRNSSSRWVEQYQPLLGSLSVATPAAPEVPLPRWIGQDEGVVTALLDEVTQVTEYLPGDESGYTLYHRSMAEFLSTLRYQDNGTSTLNRYFTAPRAQHERIARYYLRFGSNWRACDRYGLRELVSHLRARLDPQAPPDEQATQIADLYRIVLDSAFRAAQREKLGDVHATLTDLLAVLGLALERDDLVKALECIGVYRETIRAQSLVDEIFTAGQAGNFERALQQPLHYEIGSKPRGQWTVILQLYVAWEAAEQKKAEIAQEIVSDVARLPFLWGNELRDALLVRIAHSLAQIPGSARDARAWLAELAPGLEGDALLERYPLAQPLESAEQGSAKSELLGQLERFRILVEEGDAEAISMVPLLNTREVIFHTVGLQSLLTKLAATEAGQQGIDQALELVLPNPYPRYRDIGLVSLGIACLAAPDSAWVRRRLQPILRAALNQEGVIFTFDLAAILLAEAKRRKLAAAQLSDYLQQALANEDRWGTAMRARSAHAAALFWQGQTDDAFAALHKAAELPSGFAGYATITLLALANRCYEFGLPERAFEPIWGWGHDTILLDGAMNQAAQVRDLQFRDKRVQLVQAYHQWSQQGVPDIETVRAILSQTLDPEARRVYKDHVSARWARPVDGPQLDGLKALVPLVLADGTTLDAVLGRIVGLRLRTLSDADLAEAIRICATSLATSKPWEFGKWR